MKQFNNLTIKLSGFTLIELLVTIGILAIMFTIAVFSFTRSNPERLLNLTAENIIGQLQEAQSLSFTGAKQAGVTPNGYGVFVDMNNGEYKIYADTNDTYQYDGGDIIINEIYKIDLAKLQLNLITYQNADFTGWNTNGLIFDVNIFFPVPNANLIVNDAISSPMPQSCKIILTISSTAIQKIIKIRTDSNSFWIE